MFNARETFEMSNSWKAEGYSMEENLLGSAVQELAKIIADLWELNILLNIR